MRFLLKLAYGFRAQVFGRTESTKLEVQFHAPEFALYVKVTV